jgi:hypothetical protein
MTVPTIPLGDVHVEGKSRTRPVTNHRHVSSSSSPYRPGGADLTFNSVTDSLAGNLVRTLLTSTPATHNVATLDHELQCSATDSARARHQTSAQLIASTVTAAYLKAYNDLLRCAGPYLTIEEGRRRGTNPFVNIRLDVTPTRCGEA